jgi:hypothetical protein
MTQLGLLASLGFQKTLIAGMFCASGHKGPRGVKRGGPEPPASLAVPGLEVLHPFLTRRKPTFGGEDTCKALPGGIPNCLHGVRATESGHVVKPLLDPSYPPTSRSGRAAPLSLAKALGSLG